jgi:hypothetical protein
MVFTGTDPEEFADGTEGLLGAFETWAEMRGREIDPYIADATLNQRFESDGLLGRWTERALRDLLLLWMPRYLVITADQQEAVPSTVEALLEFFDARELLDERSEPIDALREHIRALTPEFHAAMAEPSNFGLVKFWELHMIEADVDSKDPVALQEFMERAQQGEIDFDQDLLEAITERELAGDVDLPHQQSARVFDPPTEDAARKLAGETRIVAWLRALADWAGDGNSDDTDDLAAQLGFPEDFDLVALATEMGVIVEDEDGLRRAEDTADALRLWAVAFGFVIEENEYSDELEDRLPLMMTLSAAPTTMPMVILADMLEDELGEADLAHLDHEIRLLADFGVVKAEEATDEELEDIEVVLREVEVPSGPISRQVVELLPLGEFGMLDLLVSEEVPVTTVDQLAIETAEVMVTRLSEASPEVFDKGADGWLAQRGPEDSVVQLRRLILRTDDAGQRLVAFQVLKRLGTPGTELLRSLRDHPTVGPFAATWLVSEGLLKQEDLSRHEVVFGLLDVLLSMPDMLVAEFAAEPKDVQLDLLVDIPKTGHPHAARALETIAAAHPDKLIAKAARKALYGLNSRR